LGNLSHRLAVIGAESESDGQALDGEARVTFGQQIGNEVAQDVSDVARARRFVDFLIVINQGRDVRRVAGSR
jgi:hypothetical protein